MFQKKKFLLFLTFFLSLPVFCLQIENVREYTLENGLEVYLLENPNDALVHIDFSCKAGFSYQNQDDAGFFTLYASLINSAAAVNFKTAQCNADSMNFSTDTTYARLEQTLEKLSEIFFSPKFSDELISLELSKLKNEVSANAEEMSFFINSSIDSKVFASAPWKNDSGIYPPLFKRTTEQNARNKIKYISENFYTPQNSALFIYGNINAEKLLPVLKNSFGRFYSNAITPRIKKSNLVNAQRKYVLHDKEISSDLTQVVLQYTMMDMDECNLLAAVLNNDYSTFKQKILEIEELNIPGADYINVASVSKGGSSRLIIQTLIQKPENKKIKTNSTAQSELFIKKTQELISETFNSEVIFAKQMMKENLLNIFDEPDLLMENLRDFWAVKHYYRYEKTESWELATLIQNEISQIDDTDWNFCVKDFLSENPFVFTIINSKDFTTNKKNYAAENYEEMNIKNSSWYVQEMYKEIRNQFVSEQNFQSVSAADNDANSQDNNFYEKNIAQTSQYKLLNGIEILTKFSPQTKDCVLMLVISGGRISSAKENGLEEVMVNILASIIQRKFSTDWNEGVFTKMPQVSAKTELTQSYIMIHFSKDDEAALCESLYSAIIYGEVLPAMADRAVSARQHKKRLENGSAVNQIFSAAVKEMYGKSDFYNIFETEKDVLSKTDYTKILSEYPKFINSSRYKIILCGNFTQNIFTSLEKTFAAIPLSTKNENDFGQIKVACKIPQKKSLTVKIEHTFLTDIPAEEAGPMPAVLIPTTEFLDPVIFIQKSPDFGTKDAAIFNALGLYITDELNSKISQTKRIEEATASFEFPEKQMPFCRFVFQNVAHTKEIDSVFSSVIQKITEDLELELSSSKTAEKIKDLWNMTQMSETSSLEGSARLMEESLRKSDSYTYYLEEYRYIQTATEKDFLETLKYFSEIPNLKVYSSESRK